jgi:glycosyltransferase involved in cell wall biosynthesis
VTVSNTEADFLRAICPENTKVAFVPHGVDTTFFSPQKKHRVKALLLVDGWYRDGELARDVINEFLKDDEKYIIRILGLRQKVMQIRHPRVVILPRITDEQLRDEYARCAAVFLPLKDATANNALLESASCGTAVIAPNLDSVVDYLGDEASLYPMGANPKEIAQHIQRVLDCKTFRMEEHWRSIGSEFSWDKVIEMMNSVYHENLLCL